MGFKEVVLVASRDSSFLADLEAGIDDLPLQEFSGDLALLEAGPHYWCFIDWLLPDISGIELCRELRLMPATRTAHITMFIDDDSEMKQRALRSGADDYMVGSITAERLIERLHRYRSTTQTARAPAMANTNDLQVDFAAMLVRYRDKRITLAPNEFKLLAHFVENQDRVFTRTALIEIMGKDGQVIDERTVDVWIGRIRRALKAQGAHNRLRTVRSMGYILDGPEITS